MTILYYYLAHFTDEYIYIFTHTHIYIYMYMYIYSEMNIADENAKYLIAQINTLIDIHFKTFTL